MVLSHAVFPVWGEGTLVCVCAYWRFCSAVCTSEPLIFIICIVHLILLPNITKLYHVNKIMYRDLITLMFVLQ